jgi:hypothetical protein
MIGLLLWTALERPGHPGRAGLHSLWRNAVAKSVPPVGIDPSVRWPIRVRPRRASRGEIALDRGRVKGHTPPSRLPCPERESRGWPHPYESWKTRLTLLCCILFVRDTSPSRPRTLSRGRNRPAGGRLASRADIPVEDVLSPSRITTAPGAARSPGNMRGPGWLKAFRRQAFSLAECIMRGELCRHGGGREPIAAGCRREELTIGLARAGAVDRGQGEDPAPC